jgi:hypothetical protein
LLAFGLVAVATERPAHAISLISDSRYVTQSYYLCDPGCRYAGDTVTAQDVYGGDFAPQVHLASGTPGQTAMTLDTALSASNVDLQISGTAAAWSGQPIAWGASILLIEFTLDAISRYTLSGSLSLDTRLGGANASLSLDLFEDYPEPVVYLHSPVMPLSSSGMLAPGTYQFGINATAYGLGASGVDFQLSIAAIPEPTTAALLVLGIVALAIPARRSGNRL